MIISILLIEGKGVSKDDLRISLAMAKQLDVGYADGFGIVMQITAESPTYFSQALIEFAKVPGVTGVTPLIIRSE